MGLALQNWLESRVAAASPLGDPHIYQTRDFPWAAEIEREWPLIRKELDAVMVFRDQMFKLSGHSQGGRRDPVRQQLEDVLPRRHWHGLHGECAAVSGKPLRLLGKIPGMTTAFFSILFAWETHSRAPGAWNGILRLHVGLMVPQPRERVKIRVGNDFYSWREGEAFIFDDTFNHEVWNDTDGYRVVLFVDLPVRSGSPGAGSMSACSGGGQLAPFLREAGRSRSAGRTCSGTGSLEAPGLPALQTRKPLARTPPAG